MVLPVYGICAPESQSETKYAKYESEVKLKGMCLFCGKPDKQYSVKFAPENLWAMEK